MLELIDPTDLEPVNPLDQDRRMRAVLVSMQLLMYGPAMNWNPSTNGGKPSGGDRPPGESRPLHSFWQQRYVLAAPDERETVIAQATDALVEARVRTVPIPAGESREDWEERLIKTGEGWEASKVAAAFLTGVREVVKIRLRYKRDPNTGRLMDGVTIQQLAAEGLTARQIMAVLPGTKPATAQYHVNKHRKMAA